MKGRGKNFMTNKIRVAVITACLFAFFEAACWQAQAQPPDGWDPKNPSPELVSQLTKELSISPKQATGGAGALFGLAKSRLTPNEFSRVAKSVPGMDGLLKAAPKPKGGVPGPVGTALPGGIAGLASVAGAFKSLGLSPDMAGKFVPVMTKFVESKGGTNVGSLLAGALK